MPWFERWLERREERGQRMVLEALSAASNLGAREIRAEIRRREEELWSLREAQAIQRDWGWE